MFGCAIAAGIVVFTALASIRPATGPDAIRSHRVVEVERGPRGTHRLALTFDAGGTTNGVAELLEALDAARVRSTFFLTGRWAQENPTLVRLVVSRGHEIGNHTWSHPDMTLLDAAVEKSEILQTDALLTQLAGHTTSRYWRAPFGARDERVLRIAHDLGYLSIYWTIDSLDSIEPPKTAHFLIERITNHTDAQLDGAIILMHVGEPATAEALPVILRELQHRGFNPVTISELLGAHESPGAR